MSDLITVGISDMKLTRSDGTLVTYALGSCVGICLYEKTQKVAAMGHIMLPYSSDPLNEKAVDKYADTCLKHLLEKLQAAQCPKSRLVAKIAGGAKMFEVTGDSIFGNIGLRNVDAVKTLLRENGIPLVAEDTGLNFGRTIYFHAATGALEVKAFNHAIKVL